jgi:small conductance mechanosensitive channel
MNKRDVDESLKPFFISLINVTLKALLVISVMGMLGIEMTSFIAILGAAGLAVGMALSGTLQNFAGGVMILIFKPFKVGDFIDAQGHMGSVKEIQIFNTILTTPDNKTIIIPNGGLSTSSMTNFSTQETRRVDFVFGIGYGDDLNKAKQIIKDIVNNDSRVLKDPEAFVRMSEMADSSVNITTRIWVKPEHYWDVYFDTMEAVYEAYNSNGINIPYPQMDVHVHNTKA